FATNQTKARLIYNSEGLEGLAAESEEELDRITDFIRRARAGHPKLDYQRNGIYLRFCHADYHKGATLAELARLLDVARENIFATNQTKARLIYNSEGLEGLAAESEEELDRITDFIRRARAGHPKLDYQRNGIYLRFCHADYHKGATLAELARLLDVARENIFA